MMRRTPMFQELLFTMVNSSNPHNYGKDLRYKYRFAVLNEVGLVGCELSAIDSRRLIMWWVLFCLALMMERKTNTVYKT